MPIDRRTLLASAAGLGLGAPLLHAAPVAQPATRKTLRALTYNVHAFGPVAPTEEGERLAGVARRDGRLLERYALQLALYEADVIAVQEATSEDNVRALAEHLGWNHAYFPGGYVDDEGRVHPMFHGALLTPHTILEQADCPAPSARADRRAVFSRHLGRVLLDTGEERWGDDGRVAVFGCHMLPAWDNTTAIREAEIRAVGEALAGDVEQGRSVLVLGDMNHAPTSPEYAGWETLGLVDTFARKGVGAPATISSVKPSQRIDYVFASGPVLAGLARCRVLAEGLFRAHTGGEEAAGSFALSDHMPVLAEFE